MAHDAISMVYAQAFLEAVQPTGSLGPFREVSKELRQIWSQEQQLQSVFSHPGIDQEHKLKLLSSCFGFIQEDLMKNFLAVLIKKNRINHLDKILEAFESLVDQEEGIEHAQVVSATPLDSHHHERLSASFSKKFNKNILFTQEVDPNLLGGLKVRIRDLVFDGTVLSQLEKLSEKLHDSQVTQNAWQN